MFATQHLSRLTAALLCLAFLFAETFRSELWLLFGGEENYGRQAFVVFRLALLVGAAAMTYISLPEKAPTNQRMVPLPSKGYDPLLTLRAYACGLVILGHGLAVVFVPTPYVSKHGAWLIMGSPWAGVWVFFVLSGYLMGKGFYSGRYSLARQNIQHFYRNRLIRIGPMYYAALMMVALLVVPAVISFENLWEILSLAVFSQQNKAPTPLIGALWSVQTEMAFYTMMPLFFMMVAWCMKVMHPLITIAILLTLGFTYRFSILVLTHLAGWNDQALVPLIANLDLFLVGIALNWILPSFIKATARLPTLTLGLVLILLSYILGAYMFARAVIPSPEATRYLLKVIYLGPTITAIISSLLILLFESFVASNRRELIFALRTVRYTQFAGVISYALYVWHEPIFLHQRTTLPAEASMEECITRLGIAIGLSVIVAWVTYRIIEAPYERKKKTIPPEALASSF